jgi:hypothetical protein
MIYIERLEFPEQNVKDRLCGDVAVIFTLRSYPSGSQPRLHHCDVLESCLRDKDSVMSGAAGQDAKFFQRGKIQVRAAAHEPSTTDHNGCHSRSFARNCRMLPMARIRSS